MKIDNRKGNRIVLIVLFLLLGAHLQAGPAPYPDSLITRANLFYANQMYEQAAELYQQVIDAGLVAPELYYNLGNAYFKQHNIPMAILNYERALQLDPGNEDIKYNLELARTYVSDKIETLPRFFLVEWYHWFLERMSSDGWARFSVIAFMVGLLLLTLFVFSKRFIWRKTGFILGIIVLFFSLLSFFFAWQSRRIMNAHDYAIVMQPAVTVKSSPDSNGTDLFVIHAGTKVGVVESQDHWTEIRLDDGSKGWLPAETITKL